MQNRSLVELDKAYGKKQDVILWTSDLTYNGNAARYLDPSRYIIQAIKLFALIVLLTFVLLLKTFMWF